MKPKKILFHMGVWLPDTNEAFHASCERVLNFTPAKEMTVCFEDLYVAIHDVWYDIKRNRLEVTLADEDYDKLSDPCMKLTGWTLKTAMAYFKRNGFKVTVTRKKKCSTKKSV